jgi:hypothetical protein
MKRRLILKGLTAALLTLFTSKNCIKMIGDTKPNTAVDALPTVSENEVTTEPLGPPPYQANDAFASVYDLGLFVNDGSGWTELVGKGYSRQPVGAVVLFPVSTGDWGRVKAWGIFEHDTGKLAYLKSFDSDIFMTCGDSLEIAPPRIEVA